MTHERGGQSVSPSLVPKGSGSSSRKKRTRMSKKSVTFNASVRVRRTTSLDDYTEEEVFAAWFQQDEFDDIKRKVLMLVRKVERDGAEIGHDKKYCIRGLESHLSERSDIKAEARKKVTKAIFFEQDKQRLTGFVDDEVIAVASRNLSSKSQLMAISMGQKDQNEAHKVYRSSI